MGNPPQPGPCACCGVSKLCLRWKQIQNAEPIERYYESPCSCSEDSGGCFCEDVYDFTHDFRFPRKPGRRKQSLPVIAVYPAAFIAAGFFCPAQYRKL